MSVPPRLRLLYPAIAPVRTSVRQRPNRIDANLSRPGQELRSARRTLVGSSVRREEVRAERYGKANAPPPHVVAALDIAKEEAKTRDFSTRKAKEVIAKDSENKTRKADEASSSSADNRQGATKQETKSQSAAESIERSTSEEESLPAKSPVPSEGESSVAAIFAGTAGGLSTASSPAAEPKDPKVSTNNSTKDDTMQTSMKTESSIVRNPPDLSKLDESVKPPAYLDIGPMNPLQKVLQLPAPDEMSEAERPPHLQPPPYVHHFNSYSLVKDLENGGFSDTQSVDIMKAVRGLLAEHLDLARRGLVSKSNIENETYLFRAACSELKTEVQAMKRTEAEGMRAQRAQLQHEVDILGQRISQDTANMKDELKGQFDDRKMALRMEVRNTDGRIQELTYKIQTVLNSDSRSEVEGIRWVLTRRAGIALALTVVMVLSTLNYSRYMTQTQERERKKHAKDMAAMRDVGTAPAVEMMSMGTQTEPPTSGEEALVAGAGVTLG